LDKFLELTIPVFTITLIILSLLAILYSLIKFLNSKKP